MTRTKTFSLLNSGLLLLFGWSQMVSAGSETCPSSLTTASDYIQLTVDSTSGADPVCVAYGTENDSAAAIVTQAAALSPSIDLTGLYQADKVEETSKTDPTPTNEGPYKGAITLGSNNLGATSGTWTIDTSKLPNLDTLVVALKRGNEVTARWGAFLLPQLADLTVVNGLITGTWTLFDCASEGTNCAEGGTGLSHATLYVVPIPAAAWLFGSALVGLAGVGYRRRQKA